MSAVASPTLRDAVAHVWLAAWLPEAGEDGQRVLQAAAARAGEDFASQSRYLHELAERVPAASPHDDIYHEAALYLMQLEPGRLLRQAPEPWAAIDIALDTCTLVGFFLRALTPDHPAASPQALILLICTLCEALVGVASTSPYVAKSARAAGFGDAVAPPGNKPHYDSVDLYVGAVACRALCAVCVDTGASVLACLNAWRGGAPEAAGGGAVWRSLILLLRNFFTVARHSIDEYPVFGCGLVGDQRILAKWGPNQIVRARSAAFACFVGPVDALLPGLLDGVTPAAYVHRHLLDFCTVFFDRLVRVEDVAEFRLLQLGEVMTVLSQTESIISELGDHPWQLVFTSCIRLAAKYLQSPLLVQRVEAGNELARLAGEAHKKTKANAEGHWLTLPNFVEAMTSYRILDAILGPRLHTELVKKLQPVIEAAVKVGRWGPQDTERLWFTAAGRHHSEQAEIYHMLGSIVKWEASRGAVSVASNVQVQGQALPVTEALLHLLEAAFLPPSLRRPDCWYGNEARPATAAREDDSGGAATTRGGGLVAEYRDMDDEGVGGGAATSSSTDALSALFATPPSSQAASSSAGNSAGGGGPPPRDSPWPAIPYEPLGTEAPARLLALLRSLDLYILYDYTVFNHRLIERYVGLLQRLCLAAPPPLPPIAGSASSPRPPAAATADAAPAAAAAAVGAQHSLSSNISNAAAATAEEASPDAAVATATAAFEPFAGASDTLHRSGAPLGLSACGQEMLELWSTVVHHLTDAYEDLSGGGSLPVEALDAAPPPWLASAVQERDVHLFSPAVEEEALAGRGGAAPLRVTRCYDLALEEVLPPVSTRLILYKATDELLTRLDSAVAELTASGTDEDDGTSRSASAGGAASASSASSSSLVPSPSTAPGSSRTGAAAARVAMCLAMIKAMCAVDGALLLLDKPPAAGKNCILAIKEKVPGPGNTMQQLDFALSRVYAVTPLKADSSESILGGCRQALLARRADTALAQRWLPSVLAALRAPLLALAGGPAAALQVRAGADAYLAEAARVHHLLTACLSLVGGLRSVCHALVSHLAPLVALGYVPQRYVNAASAARSDARGSADDDALRGCVRHKSLYAVDARNFEKVSKALLKPPLDALAAGGPAQVVSIAELVTGGAGSSSSASSSSTALPALAAVVADPEATVTSLAEGVVAARVAVRAAAYGEQAVAVTRLSSGWQAAAELAVPAPSVLGCSGEDAVALLRTVSALFSQVVVATSASTNNGGSASAPPAGSGAGPALVAAHSLAASFALLLADGVSFGYPDTIAGDALFPVPTAPTQPGYVDGTNFGVRGYHGQSLYKWRGHTATFMLSSDRFAPRWVWAALTEAFVKPRLALEAMGPLVAAALSRAWLHLNSNVHAWTTIVPASDEEDRTNDEERATAARSPAPAVVEVCYPPPLLALRQVVGLEHPNFDMPTTAFLLRDASGMQGWPALLDVLLLAPAAAAGVVRETVAALPHTAVGDAQLAVETCGNVYVVIEALEEEDVAAIRKHTSRLPAGQRLLPLELRAMAPSNALAFVLGALARLRAAAAATVAAASSQSPAAAGTARLLTARLDAAARRVVKEACYRASQVAPGFRAWERDAHHPPTGEPAPFETSLSRGAICAALVTAEATALASIVQLTVRLQTWDYKELYRRYKDARSRSNDASPYLPLTAIVQSLSVHEVNEFFLTSVASTDSIAAVKLRVARALGLRVWDVKPDELADAMNQAAAEAAGEAAEDADAITFLQHLRQAPVTLLPQRDDPRGTPALASSDAFRQDVAAFSETHILTWLSSAAELGKFECVTYTNDYFKEKLPMHYMAGIPLAATAAPPLPALHAAPRSAAALRGNAAFSLQAVGVDSASATLAALEDGEAVSWTVLDLPPTSNPALLAAGAAAGDGCGWTLGCLIEDSELCRDASVAVESLTQEAQVAALGGGGAPPVTGFLFGGLVVPLPDGPLFAEWHAAVDQDAAADLVIDAQPSYFPGLFNDDVATLTSLLRAVAIPAAAWSDATRGGPALAAWLLLHHALPTSPLLLTLLADPASVDWAAVFDPSRSPPPPPPSVPAPAHFDSWSKLDRGAESARRHANALALGPSTPDAMHPAPSRVVASQLPGALPLALFYGGTLASVALLGAAAAYLRPPLLPPLWPTTLTPDEWAQAFIRCGGAAAALRYLQATAHAPAAPSPGAAAAQTLLQTQALHVLACLFQRPARYDDVSPAVRKAAVVAASPAVVELDAEDAAAGGGGGGAATAATDSGGSAEVVVLDGATPAPPAVVADAAGNGGEGAAAAAAAAAGPGDDAYAAAKAAAAAARTAIPKALLTSLTAEEVAALVVLLWRRVTTDEAAVPVAPGGETMAPLPAGLPAWAGAEARRHADALAAYYQRTAAVARHTVHADATVMLQEFLEALPDSPAAGGGDVAAAAALPGLEHVLSRPQLVAILASVATSRAGARSSATLVDVVQGFVSRCQPIAVLAIDVVCDQLEAAVAALDGTAAGVAGGVLGWLTFGDWSEPRANVVRALQRYPWGPVDRDACPPGLPLPRTVRQALAADAEALLTLLKVAAGALSSATAAAAAASAEVHALSHRLTRLLLRLLSCAAWGAAPSSPWHAPSIPPATCHLVSACMDLLAALLGLPVRCESAVTAASQDARCSVQLTPAETLRATVLLGYYGLLHMRLPFIGVAGVAPFPALVQHDIGYGPPTPRDVAWALLRLLLLGRGALGADAVATRRGAWLPFRTPLVPAVPVEGHSGIEVPPSPASIALFTGLLEAWDAACLSMRRCVPPPGVTVPALRGPASPDDASAPWTRIQTVVEEADAFDEALVSAVTRGTGSWPPAPSSRTLALAPLVVAHLALASSYVVPHLEAYLHSLTAGATSAAAAAAPAAAPAASIEDAAAAALAVATEQAVIAANAAAMEALAEAEPITVDDCLPASPSSVTDLAAAAAAAAPVLEGLGDAASTVTAPAMTDDPELEAALAASAADAAAVAAAAATASVGAPSSPPAGPPPPPVLPLAQWLSVACGGNDATAAAVSATADEALLMLLSSAAAGIEDSEMAINLRRFVAEKTGSGGGAGEEDEGAAGGGGGAAAAVSSGSASASALSEPLLAVAVLRRLVDAAGEAAAAQCGVTDASPSPDDVGVLLSELVTPAGQRRLLAALRVAASWGLALLAALPSRPCASTLVPLDAAPAYEELLRASAIGLFAPTIQRSFAVYDAWKEVDLHPLSSARGAATPYTGLVNQGNTCYMNSLLQQLFMVPALRLGVLAAHRMFGSDDISRRLEAKNEALKDTLIRLREEYRALTAALTLSTQQAAETDVFVSVCGAPRLFPLEAPVTSQNDTYEFFSLLMDRLGKVFPLSEGAKAAQRAARAAARGGGISNNNSGSAAAPIAIGEDGDGDEAMTGGAATATGAAEDASPVPAPSPSSSSSALDASAEEPVATDLFSSVVSGRMLHQLIGRGDCPHKSQRASVFSVLSLEIRGKASLEESLAAYVAGDTLTGDNAYQCEGCGKKVDALKRDCLGAPLPDTLICHLMRFSLDYETFEKVKIYDDFAFPGAVNLYPYTSAGLAEASGEGGVTGPSATITRGDCQYRLVGVLVHAGSAGAGHYFSYIRAREGDSCPSAGSGTDALRARLTAMEAAAAAQPSLAAEEGVATRLAMYREVLDRVDGSLPPPPPSAPSSSSSAPGISDEDVFAPGTWWEFNDSTVRPFDAHKPAARAEAWFGGRVQKRVRLSSAYLLFYERVYASGGASGEASSPKVATPGAAPGASAMVDDGEGSAAAAAAPSSASDASAVTVPVEGVGSARGIDGDADDPAVGGVLTEALHSHRCYTLVERPAAAAVTTSLAAFAALVHGEGSGSPPPPALRAAVAPHMLRGIDTASRLLWGVLARRRFEAADADTVSGFGGSPPLPPPRGHRTGMHVPAPWTAAAAVAAITKALGPAPKPRGGASGAAAAAAAGPEPQQQQLPGLPGIDAGWADGLCLEAHEAAVRPLLWPGPAGILVPSPSGAFAVPSLSPLAPTIVAAANGESVVLPPPLTQPYVARAYPVLSAAFIGGDVGAVTVSLPALQRLLPAVVLNAAQMATAAGMLDAVAAAAARGLPGEAALEALCDLPEPVFVARTRIARQVAGVIDETIGVVGAASASAAASAPAAAPNPPPAPAPSPGAITSFFKKRVAPTPVSAAAGPSTPPPVPAGPVTPPPLPVAPPQPVVSLPPSLALRGRVLGCGAGSHPTLLVPAAAAPSAARVTGSGWYQVPLPLVLGAAGPAAAPHSAIAAAPLRGVRAVRLLDALCSALVSVLAASLRVPPALTAVSDARMTAWTGLLGLMRRLADSHPLVPFLLKRHGWTQVMLHAALTGAQEGFSKLAGQLSALNVAESLKMTAFTEMSPPPAVPGAEAAPGSAAACALHLGDMDAVPGGAAPNDGYFNKLYTTANSSAVRSLIAHLGHTLTTFSMPDLAPSGYDYHTRVPLQEPVVSEASPELTPEAAARLAAAQAPWEPRFPVDAGAVQVDDAGRPLWVGPALAALGTAARDVGDGAAHALAPMDSPFAAHPGCPAPVVAAPSASPSPLDMDAPLWALLTRPAALGFMLRQRMLTTPRVFDFPSWRRPLLPNNTTNLTALPTVASEHLLYLWWNALAEGLRHLCWGRPHASSALMSQLASSLAHGLRSFSGAMALTQGGPLVAALGAHPLLNRDGYGLDRAAALLWRLDDRPGVSLSQAPATAPLAAAALLRATGLPAWVLPPGARHPRETTIITSLPRAVAAAGFVDTAAAVDAAVAAGRLPAWAVAPPSTAGDVRNQRRPQPPAGAADNQQQQLPYTGLGPHEVVPVAHGGLLADLAQPLIALGLLDRYDGTVLGSASNVAQLYQIIAGDVMDAAARLLGVAFYFLLSLPSPALGLVLRLPTLYPHLPSIHDALVGVGRIYTRRMHLGTTAFPEWQDLFIWLSDQVNEFTLAPVQRPRRWHATAPVTVLGPLLPGLEGGEGGGAAGDGGGGLPLAELLAIAGVDEGGGGGAGAGDGGATPPEVEEVPPGVGAVSVAAAAAAAAAHYGVGLVSPSYGGGVGGGMDDIGEDYGTMMVPTARAPGAHTQLASDDAVRAAAADVVGLSQQAVYGGMPALEDYSQGQANNMMRFDQQDYEDFNATEYDADAGAYGADVAGQADGGVVDVQDDEAQEEEEEEQEEEGEEEEQEEEGEEEEQEEEDEDEADMEPPAKRPRLME